MAMREAHESARALTGAQQGAIATIDGEAADRPATNCLDHAANPGGGQRDRPQPDRQRHAGAAAPPRSNAAAARLTPPAGAFRQRLAALRRPVPARRQRGPQGPAGVRQGPAHGEDGDRPARCGQSGPASVRELRGARHRAEGERPSFLRVRHSALSQRCAGTAGGSHRTPWFARSFSVDQLGDRFLVGDGIVLRSVEIPWIALVQARRSDGA